MPLKTSANVYFHHTNLPVLVQAFSNAAYKQEVTITPPTGVTGGAAVYKGSGGANQPLQLTTAGFLTSNPGGWASFTSAAGNYVVTVKATDGSGNQKACPVAKASISSPTPAGGTTYLTQVSSEDATDNDWNDSLVLFTTWYAD